MQFQVNFSRKRISSFPNFTTILIFVKKNLCHISTRSGTWQVYLHRNPLCIWRPVAKKVAIFRVIPAYSSQNTCIDKHCVLILGSSNVNFAVMQYLFLKVVTLWRIEISIICSIFTLGWKFDSSSCRIVALSITQTDLAAQVEIYMKPAK